MDQDIVDYLKAQAVERLLFILKDAKNYAPGVGEAAEKELLARGYAQEEINSFLSDEASPDSEDLSGPLDAVWINRKEQKSAKGWLLMAVLLLIFVVVKVLLVQALHFQKSGEDSTFYTSLFYIFLPMGMSAFSAYAIWKLMPIGWVFGHIVGCYLILSSLLRAYEPFVIWTTSLHRDYLPESEALPWTWMLAPLLNIAIGAFILVQLNRSRAIGLFQLTKAHRRLTRILTPFTIFVLLLIAYFYIA